MRGQWYPQHLLSWKRGDDRGACGKSKNKMAGEKCEKFQLAMFVAAASI